MARGTKFFLPVDIGAPFQTYSHSYIYKRVNNKKIIKTYIH